MLEVIKNRWRGYNPIIGISGLQGPYYNERLRDYPLKVAIKMFAARLSLALPLQILLPDKRFLLNHHGAKIYIELFNHGITPFDLAFGVYEYWLTKLLFDLVREGMTILDIGAFEGDHSIMFAHMMHDRGRVLSFEPEPDNCAWFKRNVLTNNYKCIDLYECALSDREGFANFYPGTGVGSLVDRPYWKLGEPITVKAQTLDNILNSAHIDKVDLIKIDVEGSELLVLKGAERTLRKNHAHLIIDVDVVTNMERKELFELLTLFGYEIYRVGKQLKRIKSADELFLSPSSNVIPDMPSPRFDMDTKLAYIEKRIRSIIPAKLLPIIGSMYNTIRPQFGPRTNFRPSTTREIYAVKKIGGTTSYH